jgi:uncharacterized OsmC-like protein/alpha/beta superfamily hydrolase
MTSPTIRVWLTVSFLKQFAGECVWIISEINECGLATGPAAMSALENIMPREKISFPGFDGSELSALLELPDKSPLGYVLFAHCFSCGKDLASASRISRALVRRGFAVMRFDFTGLGNSDGDFANSNFSSNAQDLVCAADYLRDHHKAPSILIGHSLGGTAALEAAPSVPESKAVVTIGAPFNPEHVTKQFSVDLEAIESEGEAEVDLAGRKFKIKKQFLDDVRDASVKEELSNLRKALLVCHSPVDTTVSINEAEKIYRTAKHPKSFISLDKADHLLTRKEDAEYVAATVSAWVSRYIEPVEADESPETVASGHVSVTERDQKFARTVRSDSHEWIADEPKKLGGTDLGPDPYEHLLASLGTCTSMTIRMYANRKKMALDDVQVVLSHSREHAVDCENCEGEPQKIEKLHRAISIQGDLSEQEITRLMEIADKCPVHKTLLSDVEVTSELVS